MLKHRFDNPDHPDHERYRRMCDRWLYIALWFLWSLCWASGLVHTDTPMHAPIGRVIVDVIIFMVFMPMLVVMGVFFTYIYIPEMLKGIWDWICGYE